jgi:thioesterase domain-containing protein/acyl carrier protein
LLEVPEIGVRDDFFDLGGHSLLVIQMINQIESEFGRRLPLAPFLKNSAIENLAANLRKEGSLSGRQTLVPLQAHGTERPLFVVTAGYDDMLALNNVASHMNLDRPVYLLQPGSESEQPPLERSLDELLLSYIDAVRHKQPVGPYLLAGFCSGGLLAFALAQRLLELGETVDQLLLMDTPFKYPRFLHAIHRCLRWLLARAVRSETRGIPRRTAISGPLFSDAGLVIHLNALSGFGATVYPGRITLIYAEESHIRLVASSRRWRKVAGGDLEIIKIPGSHNSFARGEQAINLAAEMDKLLQREISPAAD